MTEMDKPVLQEAVARAIAESVGGASLTPGDDDYAAAAVAIRACMAEAQRAVLVAIDASDDYYIGGYVNRELHKIVQTALAALGGDSMEAAP